MFTFFVSLFKGLSEFLPAPITLEILSGYLIVLHNLREVFGCSLVTDLMSTMFGFSKVFSC